MRSRYSLEGGLRVGGVGIPVSGADGASSPAIPGKRAVMDPRDGDASTYPMT